MAKTGRVDLFRGTLDMLVLRTLESGSRHGYAIAREIEATTDDVLRVEEGSLYPALYRLERQGWLESDWGVSETKRRVKVYQLTSLGREHLASELDNWAEFSHAVGKVLIPR